MNTISLDDYGPVISDREVGNRIYELIKSRVTSGEKVEVDMKAIQSMATYCAKQIFGALYVELGSKVFYENVFLKNANNDIRIIVNIGIQHAIKGMS